MSATAKIWIALGTLAVVGGLAAIWLSSPPRSPKVLREGIDQEEERATEEAVDDSVPVALNPGYVGIAKCAECHAERAEEFKGTRHYVACTLASASNAEGFTAEHAVHQTRQSGMEFHFRRSGQKLLVEGIAERNGGTDRKQYEIGLVYGCNGRRDEQYFAWQGNTLWQLPVAWLHPQNCWGTIQDRIEARDVPANCLQCHNTWISQVRGTPNEYRRNGMLLGVTCERCHGPGDKHVEHHRAHPKAEAAEIVQPGTLSRERLTDVCAQCHSNVKPRGEPFSFRPGQPLEDSFVSVHAAHVEDEIVGNQGQQLRNSKCYQQSELTCVTCHDPHRPEKEADVRTTCAKCHTADSCHQQPIIPEPVRGNCTGCHMPPRVWMNVRFHTQDEQYLPVAERTDHRIGIYPEATKSVLLQWLRQQTSDEQKAEAERIGKELLAFWLKEARERREDGRLIAAIGALREALQANDDDATRRELQAVIQQQTQFEQLREQADPRDLPSAIAKLKEALKICPNHAPTHARLGSFYAQRGDHDHAVEHLEAVQKCDPTDPHGLIVLAWMAYIDGDPREAAELNEQAAALDPRNEKTQFQWGLALLGLEEWSEARTHFEAALEIQPRHALASQGLSESLRNLGRASEAVTQARNALQWTRDPNASMYLTLGRAYAANRETSEARLALQQALLAAQASQPNLLPAIEEELRRLQ